MFLVLFPSACRLVPYRITLVRYPIRGTFVGCCASAKAAPTSIAHKQRTNASVLFERLIQNLKSKIENRITESPDPPAPARWAGS
jgi:hypothetical protein